MKTQLLKEARTRAKEIARKTKNCPEGCYVAFYICDIRGYVVDYIFKGFRAENISFGSSPLSEKQVLNEIDMHELYELQF